MKYNKVLSRVTEVINDGIVLMTEEEEIEYKRKILKDLGEWVDVLEFNLSKGEWEMKKTNEVMVTIRFLYSKEDGKDEQYYKDKAFDEIYNSDDVLNADGFDVKESSKWNVNTLKILLQK